MTAFLASVDIVKVTVVALSLAFFFLDILIRSGFRLRVEDAGADLSLAALTFNASTMLNIFNEVEKASVALLNVLKGHLYRSFLLLLLAFVLWVICLRLTAMRKKRNLSMLGRSIKFNPAHILANFVGIFTFVLVVWFFVGV